MQRKKTDHRVTISTLQTSNPWSHTVVKVSDKEDNYVVSVNSKVEQPSLGYRDPEELSTKLEEAYYNYIKPAFNGKVCLDNREDIKDIPHEKICIPVTPEQHVKAMTRAKQMETASANDAKYSITPMLGGISCAGFGQEILSVIAEQGPETQIVEPRGMQRIIPLPSVVHEKATRLADFRNTPDEEKREKFPELFVERNQVTLFSLFGNHFLASQTYRNERYGLRKTAAPTTR